MLSAASIFWRERLTAEERAAYRARSVREKAAAATSIAEVGEGPSVERMGGGGRVGRRRARQACDPRGLSFLPTAASSIPSLFSSTGRRGQPQV